METVIYKTVEYLNQISKHYYYWGKKNMYFSLLEKIFILPYE